jgi:hypothetical protein
MNRKFVFVLAATVVLIVAFGGLIWVTVENNQRIASLEATVNGLQASVKDLNSSVSALENMTWHPDGNYTLSQSSSDATVNTQGKASLLNYVFNGQNISLMEITYNLRVFDSKGNVVAGIDGIELDALKDAGQGTLFIPEGQGTYTVQMTGITGSYTFTFQVESYY